ncbi:MAG: redoxin family protein [Acidobacteria bacterium]|nr:redoxin family protein [Acidobacteriota bacterium]
MAGKISQKIELITNIVIILVAILFAYFLIQKFLLPASVQPAPIREIAKGTKIDLPEVDWQANRKTLLLVLQKGCRFCTESMPFYKTLIPKASEKGVKVIAVLPNSPEESGRYLKENELPIENVRSASLNAVNAQGTPTLMLVNEKGEVSDSWVGKLLPEKEQDVIDRL